jgi:hypothetical protein
MILRETAGDVRRAKHAAAATFVPDAIRGSAFGFLAATRSFGNLAALLVIAGTARGA